MTYRNLRHIIIIVGAIALIVVAGIVGWQLTRAISASEITLTTDHRIDVTPEQIESIKAIGEWEFLSVSDEELVDTVRRGLFSDDHLVRIYYGTIRLGINMHQVEPGWLRAEGDTVEVTLPAVGLLDRDFIDEAQTKSFYESGRWNAQAREALYRRAYQQMLRYCLTPQNLEAARQNGEAQFRRMMKAMGYQNVKIRWKGEATEPSA